MKNIRLLEDRVSQAVQRLRQLSEERAKLEQELRSLREQLQRATAPAPGDAGERGESWKAERARVVAAIRETLQELRAD